MFNDEFLSKIFAHPEIRHVPVGCQATVVDVFKEVLEDILEENPYVSLSELLIPAATDDGVSAELQPEYADAEPLYG